MVDPPEGRVADWPEEAFRTVRATYWGMISEVDRQIGRLVERLKAAGAWDSTVIALTSDHGEMMGDHWTLGKFGYFDQAYHVPLILRDPRLARMIDAMGGESAQHKPKRPPDRPGSAHST